MSCTPTKCAVDADHAEDAPRIVVGAVGEDELAAGQRGDRRLQCRVRRHRRQVDVVHIVEKAPRLDAVLQHEAAQRGAVIEEEAPPERMRYLEIETLSSWTMNVAMRASASAKRLHEDG